VQLTVIGNTGPYPGPGDVCSGYLLEANGKKILLDCGSGVLQALQKKCKLDDLDAVILSHLHSDHMSDMLVMRYAMMFSNKDKLPVYMPSQPEAEAWLLGGCDRFDVIDIEYRKFYCIGDIKIYFMDVKHPVLAYATRIEYDGKVIVYSGDTMYDERLIDFASDADLFICDAAFSDEDYWPAAPHASAKQASTMAELAKVKRLVLTHFSPRANKMIILSEAKSIFKHCILSSKDLTIQI
jgi:ribonuclease BN (tRNA processing enzyme)